MQIYEFTEPTTPGYKGSPLDPKPSFGLPGVTCDACGETWANMMGRIPKDLPDNHPLRSRRRWPVSVAELNLIRADVRQVLNLPLETPLLPGTNIGVLDLWTKSAKLAAFEWPAVHVLVVREDVVAFLQEHKIAGWEIAPVRVEGIRRVESIPTMYQLFVTGTGGVPITDPPIVQRSHCEVCGRTEYVGNNPSSFQLDLSQWDGSDIFRFAAPYQGYIFVTERLAEGFRDAGFKNYELPTVESFLERRAPYANP
ncbi:MAG: hypothetical protein JWL77_4008 [Chthonomonadaceae bacterium]|nr:hypothetical protein [Chthonomonadaceae bacterium]